MDYSRVCFVIMPFGKKPVGDKTVDFDQIYKDIFEPAINMVALPAPEQGHLEARRTDKDFFAGDISYEMFNYLEYSRFALADITGLNANVFYELGLAHALKKPVVLVSSNEEDVPFDLHHIRVIYYNVTDPFWGTKLIEKVAENILSAIRNPEEAIFKGSNE